jgi:hypothetical protein
LSGKTLHREGISIYKQVKELLSFFQLVFRKPFPCPKIPRISTLKARKTARKLGISLIYIHQDKIHRTILENLHRHLSEAKNVLNISVTKTLCFSLLTTVPTFLILKMEVILLYKLLWVLNEIMCVSVYALLCIMGRANDQWET